jgi:hypothetical protein
VVQAHWKNGDLLTAIQPSWFASKNLLQFREDCVLSSTDQRFRVRTVAKGEPDLTGGVRIHDRLPVQSGRLQVAIFKEQRHNVFIVEVRRAGHTQRPGAIPHDYALILQDLLHARPRMVHIL